MGNRILQFGLTRIVLGVVTIVGVGVLTNFIVLGLYGALGIDAAQDSLYYVIPLVIAVHFTYVGFVRLVERRRAEELSGEGAVRETGAGIAVGAGLLATTIGIIAALGYYQVTGSNPVSAIGPHVGRGRGRRVRGRGHLPRPAVPHHRGEPGHLDRPGLHRVPVRARPHPEPQRDAVLLVRHRHGGRHPAWAPPTSSPVGSGSRSASISPGTSPRAASSAGGCRGSPWMACSNRS